MRLQAQLRSGMHGSRLPMQSRGSRGLSGVGSAEQGEKDRADVGAGQGSGEPEGQGG